MAQNTSGSLSALDSGFSDFGLFLQVFYPISSSSSVEQKIHQTEQRGKSTQKYSKITENMPQIVRFFLLKLLSNNPQTCAQMHDTQLTVQYCLLNTHHSASQLVFKCLKVQVGGLPQEIVSSCRIEPSSPLLLLPIICLNVPKYVWMWN